MPEPTLIQALEQLAQRWHTTPSRYGESFGAAVLNSCAAELTEVLKKHQTPPRSTESAASFSGHTPNEVEQRRALEAEHGRTWSDWCDK